MSRIYKDYFSEQNIRARQELLLDSIGVFPEETEAFEAVSLMSWVLPLCATLVMCIDFLLILIANFLIHPWVAIVSEDTKGDCERVVKEAEAVIAHNKVLQSLESFFKG